MDNSEVSMGSAIEMEIKPKPNQTRETLTVF